MRGAAVLQALLAGSMLRPSLVVKRNCDEYLWDPDQGLSRRGPTITPGVRRSRAPAHNQRSRSIPGGMLSSSPLRMKAHGLIRVGDHALASSFPLLWSGRLSVVGPCC